jgi:hypothetical protein
VFEYVAQFKILAADHTWNDETLTSQFRFGLSSEIKDLALSLDKPATLALWTVLAIQLENRFTERRQERLTNNPRGGNPRNPNAASNPFLEHAPNSSTGSPSTRFTLQMG